MSDTQATHPQPPAKREKKKWTLMFFFASDNILSPSMLSQIKAIKSAGYQTNTNVLVHFDPNEKGVPTRIFALHQNDKPSGKPSSIGDSDAPLVSVLAGDAIRPGSIEGLKRKEIDQMEAQDALRKFLTICREQYPAEHYMLFLIGHGMIVGGDSFLPDDNPISAIGLKDLEDILKEFRDGIKSHDGVLELLGMHSCSMSGVEIAYQLQDTATYMLASQGISFVGAWPYRQLLITIFKAVEAERLDPAKPVDVLELAEKLHDLCIQHSADFMVGGYSADLCLCTLHPDNVRSLNGPIKSLGEALKQGLKEGRCRDLILLAHWKSQSYWQETYTDLYDFCLCLRRLCIKHDERRPSLRDMSPSRQPRRHDVMQKAIEDACLTVMEALAPKHPNEKHGPVIRTDFIGAGSQYSHGLSIYFPWSEPVEDKRERALTNYKNYEFAENCPTAAWLEFLESYFNETKRPNRMREDKDFGEDVWYENNQVFKKMLDAAEAAFMVPGAGGSESVPSTALEGKVSPPDSGGGCVCPSIKNYSRDIVMSPGAAGVRARKTTDRDSGSAPDSSNEKVA